MTLHFDLYYISPSDKEIPIKIAKTFKHRFFGLMGQKDEYYGLLLEPCNCIHTFFMRYPIDIIYLDKNNRVITTTRYIKPFRLTLPVFGAKKVLEFPSSLNAIAFLKEGTYIDLKKNETPIHLISRS
ncbi:MAG: DUF192 domain-containing protein [Clostridiaceae bacterium]|nr:DUF192 domain-containing protein [Clostridiaceae bacterium]